MTPEETSESPRRDWFVRAAAGIGDFGNPFYAEERQRDVWNEASAFGLQLLLWLSMLTATISVWVFGAPAVPYALSLLALVSVAAIATASYAARLGVTDSTALKRAQMLRIVPYAALLVLFFVGVFRALPRWRTAVKDLAPSCSTSPWAQPSVVGPCCSSGSCGTCAVAPTITHPRGSRPSPARTWRGSLRRHDQPVPEPGWLSHGPGRNLHMADHYGQDSTTG